MSIGALVLTVACGSSPVPQLRLDGPAEVQVEALGPVDGPRVVLENGHVPDGLIWTLSRDGVARIVGGRVVAEGPGEVQVAAEWEGERVVWTLRVELATMLAFVDPPSVVAVGSTVTLPVAAKVGDVDVDPGQIVWTSSNPSVLQVDASGTVVGVSAGMAYVTARARGASAMAEIEVVESR
jgi:hypothetical protein